MKLGDIVRFKKTGVVGTIVEVLPHTLPQHERVVQVFAHNIEKVIPNPSIFSVSHLQKVADIISHS
jgi:hypothetical protein